MGRERRTADGTAKPAVWSDPRMRDFLLSWTLSNMALWAWAIVIATVTFREGGATGVALALAARLIPGAFCSPIAAVLAARAGGTRGIVLILLLRTTAVLTGSVVLLVDGPLWLLYLAVIIEGAGSGPMHPLHIRMLPLLAQRPEDLASANSLTELLRAAGLCLGPCICGAILYFADAPQVMWACVALIAGALVLLRRVGGVAQTIMAGEGQNPFAQIMRGVSVTARAPAILLLVVISMLAGVVLGCLQLLLTGVSIDILAWGQVGPSVLLALVGFGGLAGGGVSLSLAGRRSLSAPLAAGMTCIGLAAIVLGLTQTAWPVAASCLAGGIGLSLLLVMLNSLLQRTVPLPVQAAVFGLSAFLQFIGIALGGALGSALVALAGLGDAPVLFGVGLAAVSFTIWLLLRAAVPDTDFEGRAFNVVRQSHFFRDLAVGPAFQLASSLVPEQASKGLVIFRQGDTGEDAYLVESGHLDVRLNGRVLANLGPGDVFGEIALLKDVPRTASVAAKSEARVWKLSRDAFIYAVTGTPECFQTVSEVSQKRLDAIARRRRKTD
ncbi:MAG: MFS transporter [Pseudomonadota bacterium]|nr:MFS transporter [Pseudomonadota bacterium]